MTIERRCYGACILAWVLIAGCSGDDDQGAPADNMHAGGSGGAKASSSISTGGTTVKPITTAGTGGTATSGTGGASAMTMTMTMTGSGGVAAMLDAGTMQPDIEKPPAMASSGCGASDSPPSGNFTIDVAGTARDYIVAIPADYDPSKPYKLIFAWHGLGGTAMQTAGGFGGGYYGLQSKAMGSALFVAGQGLETSQGGAGWPNSNGQDIAFVRALLDWMRSKYCIDEKRIFSVGMSYGGIMSNTIGCELGDVFRAIAPMSGSGPRSFGGGAACVGQVAVWSSHGDMDDVVATMSGEMSRDHWVANNHCDAETKPVDPSPCVAYQGCDDGFPVTWCLFAGGHTVPPFASQAIWDFLSQF